MILLLETVHADAHELLEADHEVQLVDDPSNFDPADYSGVRAVVTRGRGQVTAAVIAALPDLEVIARCGVGLDNIDTSAAKAANIPVVHAPGLLTTAVAEQALLLMLAVSRKLVIVDRAVKEGNWAIRNGFESSELSGKRLGVVGLGAIGTRIAELGQALNMDVVCSTRRSGELAFPKVSFDELLATSDVIQICVPLTDETRHLFDAAAFAKMKDTAVLINTARGGIVDRDALADALEAGSIAGYGADGWDPEPPDADDRVIAYATSVVTPHVAVLTDVTYREICVVPSASVLNVLAGNGPDPVTLFNPS